MQTDVMKSSGDANGCDFDKVYRPEGSTLGKRLSAGRLTPDAYRRLCRLVVRWNRRTAAVSVI